jgi:hypothetical protein
VPRDFSSLLEGDQRRKLKAPYFALRDFILAIMVATRCAEHVMPLSTRWGGRSTLKWIDRCQTKKDYRSHHSSMRGDCGRLKVPQLKMPCCSRALSVDPLVDILARDYDVREPILSGHAGRAAQQTAFSFDHLVGRAASAGLRGRNAFAVLRLTVADSPRVTPSSKPRLMPGFLCEHAFLSVKSTIS